MRYNLVWFKRDLRCEDHAALVRAASCGPIRCIYVIEPSLWRRPDMALGHFNFISESLIDLDRELRRLGGGLEIFTGEVVEIFEKIWRSQPFISIFSHEETGNQYTYDRDKHVRRWCHDHHISWYEYPQFGVVRGLKNRNVWQGAWERHMSGELEVLPVLSFWHGAIPPLTVISAPECFKHDPPRRQKGGRIEALRTLEEFLDRRSQQYRGGISSPLSAPHACSRISTYLAYGCLSMREVVSRTRARINDYQISSSHKRSLEAFLSRLFWHCHFIQKLESEPEIEWRNMHRGYDGLREDDFNDAYFEALKSARTGWPMVDACVTMLRETGWLNFRMRAMLVSISAYPLWLHWRPVGEWLATQFLDYEPGIHWSQLQMQSGTTGINTTRIYNPIKQAMDHDPAGRFVRAWLPYMRQVPDTYLYEPWCLPEALQEQYGVRVGIEIPKPIVDLSIATKAAKSRLYSRRQQPEVKAAKKTIVQKHGSRKILSSRKVKDISPTTQLGFDFS